MLDHQQANFSQDDVMNFLTIKGYPDEQINTILRDLLSVYEEKKTEYYTVQEVAEMHNVTVPAVHKWIKQGKVEYEEKVSFGGAKQYFLPKSQFEKENTPEQKRFALMRKMKEPVDREEMKCIAEALEDHIEEMGFEVEPE